MKSVFCRCLPVLLVLSHLQGAFAQSASNAALDAEQASQSGTVIHIIFDDSGSMATNDKLGQAQSAFFKWLESGSSIPEGSKFSFTALNKGLLTPVGADNLDRIRDNVQSMRAEGSTPLNKTIINIAQSIEKRRQEVTPYERHIVVVFTDGEDSSVRPPVVQETLRQLSKAEIETVGIGFHGQGDYMRGAATQYFDANNSTELLTALNQVASEVDQQVDIVITPEVQAAMDNPRPTAVAAVDSPATRSQPVAQPGGGGAALKVAKVFFGSICTLVAVFGIAIVFALTKAAKKK